LFTSSLRTLAQSLVSATDSVSALFTKFIQTSTDKSIVLLTDRNVYMAGEKIWFKAYLVNENNRKLDLTIRNLFADLVNEKDSIIEQLVLDNISLHTDGAFWLPESIPTGFYWIRCYTARQLESDSNGIFLHPVYIVNKQLHDESLYAKKFENNLANNNKFNPFIHFFAERLTAIPGIISTGVIEIRDGYYNPLSVKGGLVNSKDSIITSFKTNSFGLARLTFVEDSAEKYTAIFYFNDHAIRYQLPAVNKTFIQLSVANQTAKTIKAFVTLEESVPANYHTTILAVQRDSLYYAAVGTGNYGITIPIDDFPGGIVRLLLFDKNKTLISERKIYIPKKKVGLEIKPDKKKYSERENVSVHIKVTGPDGKPLASELNVAVQDEWIEQLSDSIEANTLPPSDEFLLDSWLNRYHIKYSADDIDLLMATKKSIFQQSFPIGLNKEIQDYDDNKKLQNLMAKIIDKKGNGMSDLIVTAIAKNTRGFFMEVDTTHKDGIFRLSIPQGFDSLQLSLQVTDKHQAQTFTDSIKIDSFHYPRFSTPLSLKQQFLANNINTLALLQGYHVATTITFQGKGLLIPVTVKAIKKEELNYDASKRINSISQILTSDKFRYGGYNSLGNAILMVPGVTLSFGDIAIFGSGMRPGGYISRPLLIMDGYALPSDGVVLDFLNSLNPADIDFIEVLRGGEAGIYGVRGGAGVISINTKHGPDKTNYRNNNLRVFTPVTYHVCPKFEMADYSNKEIKNSSNPDSRTTIYWKGNITTDANGEANINFYTADNATNYTITITGLTENGYLAYKRVIIDNTGKGR
jgi:TonB-dependent Receptor Plug Domain